jgi:hypothetical protein
LLYHFPFDIFYRCFRLQGTSASQHRQETFHGALHDEGQQEIAGAWSEVPEALEKTEVSTTQQEAPEEPEVRAAQLEAPEEPNIISTQQEAPVEPNVEDEAGDQPLVTYMLDQF